MTPQEKGSSTTTDLLLGGRVKIVQPQEGYRVAVDPILLAASITLPPSATVLDVGCGTGGALFCLLSRLDTVRGVGLEQHGPFADLARRGADENDFAKRAEIVTGNLAVPPKDWAASFDAVMTNPPFFEAGTVPSRPGQDSTHAVTDLSLPSWIAQCLSLLRQGGLFSIIHRAERLADIIQALSGCGSIVVIPIWPKVNTAAKRVIVTALKGRKSPATLCPGLILHTEDDSYTAEADAILRDGAALKFLP
ncbi:MAG: methyltransferase [Rhodospirillaceae bacterium]|jgi:tRNA1(Val) A37 N6-methylase TrmN6|nr:methyltransferase [Rhodospirillaceae bacterium]MBT5240410.1 methyltransferase [Rhodospirillaceae bacterium]MBT5566722.1 methyltransferase [Rhodospirillaceae bacterium]MBT6090773.1 methyltransferase [Rhodospirillaceae bacterium]MBT6961053.1 methyltransferase [Rhodospirillaceae bacterium]